MGKGFRGLIVLFVAMFLAASALTVFAGAKAMAADTITVTVNNGPTEGDLAAKKEMSERVARFNEVYPNVKIKLDPWIYDPASFTVKFTGGTATDVIYVAATELAGLIGNGYAADITEQVRNWKHYQDLNLDFLGGAMENGHIYGIPVHGYVMGLIYNKKLFKEAGIAAAPKTWSEFAEVAKKLTNKKKGQYGFGIMGSGLQGGWQMLNWVWQAGGDFEKKVNGRWTAAFNSAEAIRAFEFIQDLKWKYDAVQPNFMVPAEQVFPLMAGNRIAMMLGTPEWIPIIVKKYGGHLEDYGMALLPAGPAGRASQMGGLYAIVNGSVKDKKVIDASFKWMTFEFEPRERAEIAKIQRDAGKYVGIPENFLFKPAAQKEFDAIIDKYRNFPNFTEYSEEAGKYARPEPPIAAQQLYATLESVEQAVLSNPYADPKKLLNQAAADFQKRFLDPLNK